jgi:polyvinyl alcohol dehydrogenase (cytochrome)
MARAVIPGRRPAPLGLAAIALAAALSAGPARALAVCSPDGRPGGEWPMMGHDLGHTRTQPNEHVIDRRVAPTLAPAWTFSANDLTGETKNEITGYPIVADGCVFVGSSTGFGQPGWVFAISAGDATHGGGGELVWKTKMTTEDHLHDGGVYSTVAVDGSRRLVYAYVSHVGAPYLAALDEGDGHVVWAATVDTQAGSDAVSSPVVFDGMVWVGVSGTLAEGDETDRFRFRGASVLLDASRACDASATFICAEPGGSGGRILAHEFSIPDAAFEDGAGDAGGALWSTISIDPDTKYGFVGSGNPFSYEHENSHTNAILKIDLDRARASTFGTVVASYKGNVDQYFGPVADSAQCDRTGQVFVAGFECAHLDLDFGAAPNLFVDRLGNKRIGEGQKSGVYHAIDPDPTKCVASDGDGACLMPAAWTTVMGVPSAVGGIVGSAAFDGTALYVPHSIAGYLVSLDRDSGAIRWLAPVADGVHWGNPVTVANGIVYTADLKGFLNAYDAGTGVPLLHRPMEIGANTGLDPTFTWGGVTVARGTVFASVGVGITSAGEMFPSMPNGFVIAFRPAKVGL